nr:uncharacterized protein LOC109772620 isoform X2 [Aegilops tauschii subsp. strangulata]
MAIGFLLGLLVELSSSWRPRFSLPPGPSAPAPRGSKRAAAGSSAAPAPGEELKMALLHHEEHRYLGSVSGNSVIKQ